MLEKSPNELSALLVASSLTSLLAMILLFPMALIFQISELMIMIRNPMGTYRVEEYVEWGLFTTILLLVMVCFFLLRTKLKNQAKSLKSAVDYAADHKLELFKEDEAILIIADLTLSLFFFMLALIQAVFLQTYDLVFPAFLCLFSGLSFQFLSQRKMARKVSANSTILVKNIIKNK